MSIGPATYYIYYRSGEKKAIGKIVSYTYGKDFSAIYFERSNDINLGTFDTLEQAHLAIVKRKDEEGVEARKRLKL